MSDNSANNKRIAKNTIMLYFRMIVTLVVGLFTSRIVLESLGIENYGIYNVVGGFVSMFSVVNSGLVAATQRYLSFDLGKGDTKELNKTFSSIVMIYIILCCFVVLIAGICGFWFIEEKLNIACDRIDAAYWVFYLSIITLVLSLISNPYNALIIAHERMKAFAYITIFDVMAKLLITYLLYIYDGDRLILYAILMCIMQAFVRVLYTMYCKRNFKNEVQINYHFDWHRIKELYGFAGWTMIGSFAYMGFTQGLNLLLGIFFNPAVNAARGIAVQVQGIVLRFVSSFQTAVDPQITKSFARGDISYLNTLVFLSSKYSFFLLYVLSLPLILVSDALLKLWLVEVPEYTSVFFKLIMITTMYDSITNPFAKAVQATGKIKYYSIFGAGILLFIVPIAYIVLRNGGAPYSVFIVHIVLGFVALIQRIVMAKNILNVTFAKIWKDLARPILNVVILSLSIGLYILRYSNHTFMGVFLTCFIIFIFTLLCIYLCGIDQQEKKVIISKFKNIKKN